MVVVVGVGGLIKGINQSSVNPSSACGPSNLSCIITRGVLAESGGASFKVGN